MAQVNRIKVEPGIWFRESDRGGQQWRGKRGLYEIAYRDAEGRQRRAKVAGGLTAARKQLRDAQTKRDKGERQTQNPRLRFKDAAAEYLAVPAKANRGTTVRLREQSIRVHLLPRFENRRMDQITVKDAARLIADMREKEYAENSIQHVVTALRLIFEYAAARLGGPEVNPVSKLLPSERAKPGKVRVVIYEGGQLEETIAAAREPYRTMFRLASVIGARVSEVIGLHWRDLDDGVVSIRGQVATHTREYTEDAKTATSIRDVPIPEELSDRLERFKEERALEGFNVADEAFMFNTRAGRSIDHREVGRELKRAQKRARTPGGLPSFPVMHEKGRKIKRDDHPTFHSFRHQAASRYIAAGMPIEVVADLLGDTPQTVMTTYRQQIHSRKNRQAQTDLMAKVFADALNA